MVNLERLYVRTTKQLNHIADYLHHRMLAFQIDESRSPSSGSFLFGNMSCVDCGAISSTEGNVLDSVSLRLKCDRSTLSFNKFVDDAVAPEEVNYSPTPYLTLFDDERHCRKWHNKMKKTHYYFYSQTVVFLSPRKSKMAFSGKTAWVSRQTFPLPSGT